MRIPVESSAELTFGLPVVPLDMLKNASFVRASPGLSPRSVKLSGFVIPWPMTSLSVVCEPLASPGTSKTIMCSGGMPTARAASSATSRFDGWTMRALALVRVSWYLSSSGVKAGLDVLLKFSWLVGYGERAQVDDSR